jgi:hypothetical protein
MCLRARAINRGSGPFMETRHRWGSGSSVTQSQHEGLLSNFVFSEKTRRYQPQIAFAQYMDDVRKRKRTTAIADGEFYGAGYATRAWGISEFPIYLVDDWRKTFIKAQDRKKIIAAGHLAPSIDRNPTQFSSRKMNCRSAVRATALDPGRFRMDVSRSQWVD